MEPSPSERNQTPEDVVAAALGLPPRGLTRLLGGCVAEVFRVDLENGPPLVAKVARDGGLAVEGYMLDFLAGNTRLPVPQTRHVSESLLLMDYVDHDSGASTATEEDAAERLAALHAITAPAYGFERDTVIGALPQPNAWAGSWCDFYRDRRLLVMGRIARDSGRLPAETHRRLEAFCNRLERFIEQPPQPGLVHGDVWAGNVLFRGNRVAAFIDPALYFADPEVEIAYIELLSTFGPAFHRHYEALRPPRPGYHEARRDIYNLFPLLVHTQICGPPYAQMVQDILIRYA
ncbi:fructosamine kinase family protein [Pelagibius litoralis]|uniref:Fructosamine kinase family protein n=1 Tax=Pelagibius litoralis TaxID=374515 RepID=A0A967K9I6_9PROT|nr:fructosamine kinase family protein [Pelagibius litoralis]NIA71068.1 fructosamine kinase family protein [Pelagibius litoralis]